MKTPEQQVKEAEEQNKDLIARTIKIPLTSKQLNTINEISNDKVKYQEKYNDAAKREQDIINFTLEFKGIEAEEIESLRVEGKDIVVVKKLIEKPLKKEVEADVKEASMEDFKEVLKKVKEEDKELVDNLVNNDLYKNHS